MFTLDDVLAGTEGSLVGGHASGIFRSVRIDSRAVEPGDLFVAFRGARADGHDFVEAAFANHAGGALVDTLLLDRPWSSPDWSGPPVVLCDQTGRGLADMARYWRRRHGATVVGITGSVGKTSTKEAVSSLLSQSLSVLRTRANYNTEIGLPMSLMELEPHHRIAVLELGMQAIGEIRLLARICEPNIGLVTNVHPSHLERLGSMEQIAQAKSELVRELPDSGMVILNADDDRVASMASLARCEVMTFGTRASADLRAVDIRSLGLGGVEFEVQFRGDCGHARMQTIGIHTVYSGLAAIAVGLRVGIALQNLVAGLARVEPGPRLVPRQGPNNSTLLDDTYNASPPSVAAALSVLAEAQGRRIAVLGDMLELGPLEASAHADVGRQAAAAADWLLTIGPRAQAIGAAAIDAGMEPTSVDICQSNVEVLARLRNRLRPGDTVLLKGSRAMRLEEVVSGLCLTR